jgi:hypothetical protein
MAKEIISGDLEYSDIITEPTFDARINRPQNITPKRTTSLSEDIKNAALNSFPSLLADRLTGNMAYDSFNVTPEQENEFDKWKWFNDTNHLPDEATSYDSEVLTYHDALKWEAKRQTVAQRNSDLQQAGFSGAALKFYTDMFMSPTGVASMAVPFGPIAKGGLALRTSKMAGAGAALGVGYAAERSLVDPTYTTEEAKTSIMASTAVMALLGPAVGSLAERGKNIDDFSDQFVNQSSELYGAQSQYYNANKRSLSAAGAGFNFEPVGPEYVKAAVRVAAIMTPANRVSNFVAQESKNFFQKIAGRPTYYTQEEAAGMALPESVSELRMPVEMEYQRNIDGIRADLKNYITQGMYKQRTPGVAEKLKDLKKYNQNMEVAYEDWYRIVQDESLTKEDILALSETGAVDDYLYKAAYKTRVLSEKEIEEDLALGIEGAVKRKNYGTQFTFHKNKASAGADDLYTQLKEDSQAYVDELKTKYVNEYKDAGAMRQAMQKELDDFKAKAEAEAGNDSAKLNKIADDIEDAKEEMEELLSILNNLEDAPSLLASKLLSEIIHGKSPSVSYIRGTKVVEKPGFYLNRNLNPLKYQKWAETRPEVLLQIRGRRVGTARAMKRLYGHAAGRTARKEYMDKMDDLIAAQREAESGLGKEIDNSLKGKVKRKIKKEATADELVKEKNSVLQQFDDLLAQHYGDYNSDFYKKHPYLAFGAEAMKTWNEVSMLGNVVAGSISEAAAVVIHHGIKATMPEYKKVLQQLVNDPTFYKATVKELQAMDHAMEWSYFEMIQDIIGQGGNIGDQYVSGYTVMQNLKKYNYLLNGLTIWDHFNRLVVAKTQMTVLSKKLRKIANGKATKYEIMDMAKLGIGEGQAKMIVQELDAGGEEVVKGLSQLRPDKMSKGVAEQMKIALTNDIYRIALKQRTGDIPISMAHPIVSLLTQFKTWPMLATQKYMIPLMQRQDGQSMAAIATLAGFGTLSYMLKEKLAGRDISDHNMADMLYGGITQSGVLGISPELFMDWAANKVGIEGGAAKYSGINPLLHTLVGPTSTTISRIDQASKIFPGGADATDWSYHSLWKLLPLANHPVFTVEK